MCITLILCTSFFFLQYILTIPLQQMQQPEYFLNALFSRNMDLIGNKKAGDNQDMLVVTSSSLVEQQQLKHSEMSLSGSYHINIPSADKRIGPDGQLGYVHDPTFLRKKLQQHPSRSTDICDSSNSQMTIMAYQTQVVCAKPGEGPEGREGSLALARIRHHIESAVVLNNNVTVFCAVYTYAGGIAFTNAIQGTL